MKYCFILFLSTISLLISSCGVSQEEYDNVVNEKNTIKADLDELQYVQNVLKNFASCLDSINGLENSLRTVDENGKLLSKDQILENMNRYQDVLFRQKETIESLKDSLSTSSIFVPLFSIISYTNSQIEERETQVKQLQEEVASGKQKINALNGFVSNLRSNVNKLEETSRNQELSIHLQDKTINQCFYLVCDKNTLKDNNLIGTNMLGGNIKLQYGELAAHNHLFTKGDRRELDVIQINGKSPKLLTQAPASSYKITTVSSTESKLEILDYNSFWSASDYLVILVK